MSRFPKLDAIRIAWRDPITEETQRYLDQVTQCSLEEQTQQELHERLPMYRLIVASIRAHVTDRVARDKCIKALQQSAFDHASPETMVDAHFVGGERGQRTGEARARRMIKEARQFGEQFVHTMLPSEDDVSDGSSD